MTEEEKQKVLDAVDKELKQQKAGAQQKAQEKEEFAKDLNELNDAKEIFNKKQQ